MATRRSISHARDTVTLPPNYSAANHHLCGWAFSQIHHQSALRLQGKHQAPSTALPRLPSSYVVNPQRRKFHQSTLFSQSAATQAPPPPERSVTVKNPLVPTLELLWEVVGLEYAPCGPNKELYQGALKDTLSSFMLGFTSPSEYTSVRDAIVCLSQLQPRPNRLVYSIDDGNQETPLTRTFEKTEMAVTALDTLVAFLSRGWAAKNRNKSPFWMTQHGAKKAGFQVTKEIVAREELLLREARQGGCWLSVEGSLGAVVGPEEGFGDYITLFNTNDFDEPRDDGDKPPRDPSATTNKLLSQLRAAAQEAFGPSFSFATTVVLTPPKVSPRHENCTVSEQRNVSFPDIPAPPHVQHFTASGQPIPPAFATKLASLFQSKAEEQINRLKTFNETKSNFATPPNWMDVEWSLLSRDHRRPAEISCFWATQKELLAKGISLRRDAKPITNVPVDGSWLPSSSFHHHPPLDDAPTFEDERYENLLKSLSIGSHSNVQRRAPFIKSWFRDQKFKLISKDINSSEETTATSSSSPPTKFEGLFNLSQCVDRERAVAAVRGARFWSPLPHLHLLHDDDTTTASPLVSLLDCINDGGNETDIFADPFYYFKFKNGRGESLPRTSDVVLADSDARRANAVAHRLHALLGLLLHPNTFPDLVCTATEASIWWDSYIASATDGTSPSTSFALPATASTTNSPPAWLTSQVVSNSGSKEVPATTESASTKIAVQPTVPWSAKVDFCDSFPLASALLSQYADLTFIPLSAPQQQPNPSFASTTASINHHHHGALPLHNFWLTAEEMELLGLQLTQDPKTIGSIAVAIALHTYLKKYYFGENSPQHPSKKKLLAKQPLSGDSASPDSSTTNSLWDYDELDSSIASSVMNSQLLALETSNRLGSNCTNQGGVTPGTTPSSATNLRTATTIVPIKRQQDDSGGPLNNNNVEDVCKWVMNEVAKADVLQVKSYGSSLAKTAATVTGKTAKIPNSKKQTKFPFLPDSLEVILMDVFASTSQNSSKEGTKAAQFPEGFSDMVSFKRCSDGKRAYCALFCTPVNNAQSTLTTQHIISGACVSPKRFPGSPDSNIVVVSNDAGSVSSGRPQTPSLYATGMTPTDEQDEWIPVQLSGSERLLGNELSPKVLSQLTLFRAQHDLWDSVTWHLIHFTAVGSKEATSPQFFSGWVNRRDLTDACAEVDLEAPQRTPYLNVNLSHSQNTTSSETSAASCKTAERQQATCQVAIPLPIDIPVSDATKNNTTANTFATVRVPVYLSLTAVDCTSTDKQ